MLAADRRGGRGVLHLDSWPTEASGFRPPRAQTDRRYPYWGLWSLVEYALLLVFAADVALNCAGLIAYRDERL
jgi:hypothetical protein